MGFFKDAWEGFKSIITGGKGARKIARYVQSRSDADLWREGLSNTMALATGDIAGKSDRGRAMQDVGSAIADYAVAPMRTLETLGFKSGGLNTATDLVRGAADLMGPEDGGQQEGDQDEEEPSAPAEEGAAANDEEDTSMARGGRVKRTGRVRVHDKELIISARKRKRVLQSMRKNNLSTKRYR